MKKLPKRKKHWAKECYTALMTACDMFYQEIPELTDENKIEILKYAPRIAAINRGIKNESEMNKACGYIYERLSQHVESALAQQTGLHYPVIFIISYLNAMISFGFINERLSKEILEITMKSYDLDSVF